VRVQRQEQQAWDKDTRIEKKKKKIRKKGRTELPAVRKELPPFRTYYFCSTRSTLEGISVYQQIRNVGQTFRCLHLAILFRTKGVVLTLHKHCSSLLSDVSLGGMSDGESERACEREREVFSGKEEE
jgi:hypothetical protein